MTRAISNKAKVKIKMIHNKAKNQKMQLQSR